jgi:hypothetical protein
VKKTLFPWQTLPRRQSYAAKKYFRHKLFHIENHIKDWLQADEIDQAHIHTKEFGKGFAYDNKKKDDTAHVPARLRLCVPLA